MKDTEFTWLYSYEKQCRCDSNGRKTKNKATLDCKHEKNGKIRNRLIWVLSPIVSTGQRSNEARRDSNRPDWPCLLCFLG